MNITKMSDTELAKELQRHFDVPVQSLEIARFIRKCAQDSLPTKIQLMKIIQSSAWDENGELGIGIEYVEIIATALRKMMERKLDVA